MAGKKYQAESKTVQKMTRNGLVEEDLHTGKTRRAVTHETEGPHAFKSFYIDRIAYAYPVVYLDIISL